VIIALFLPAYAQETSRPSQEEIQRMQLQNQEYVTEKLKSVNSAVYVYQKRLLEIENEIRKIARDYEQRELTKEEAKEKLVPLIEERLRIQNNPDYLAETVLTSLPQGTASGGHKQEMTGTKK
jgi:hypothetical protein